MMDLLVQVSMVVYSMFDVNVTIHVFIIMPYYFFHYTPRNKVVGGYSGFTIFRHIKSNNSGTAKVKIVKNERDPPLFTSKQLIKF
jgi:hypothetical protein